MANIIIVNNNNNRTSVVVGMEHGVVLVFILERVLRCRWRFRQ